jgi:hypothetical protein
MLDPSKSNGEKRDLFRKAVKVHGSEMKDASSGMGVDRHLFGTSLHLFSLSHIPSTILSSILMLFLPCDATIRIETSDQRWRNILLPH